MYLFWICNAGLIYAKYLPNSLKNSLSFFRKSKVEAFLILWQNLKWQNYSFANVKLFLTFDMEKLLSSEVLLAIFVKAKSKGLFICKIVNSLVSNFASVLFDFDLKQVSVVITHARTHTLTGLKIAKRHPNGKKNHICKWTFSYFNFCHNRRNQFLLKYLHI